jgi:hypothetical protein
MHLFSGESFMLKQSVMSGILAVSVVAFSAIPFLQTKAVAQGSNCPTITGSYQRPSDKLVMSLFQSGCEISGTVPPPSRSKGGFNHTIEGEWSNDKAGFEITIVRINRVNGCVTEMTGTVYRKHKKVRVLIDGSDGKCDLPVSYSEDTVWNMPK